MGPARKKRKELAGRQKELYQFIGKNPGLHLRELQRRLEVSSMGNLEYHIQMLEKLKLIVEKTEGGYKRYYPVHGAVKNKELLALLRQKMPRRIVILIIEKMRQQGCLEMARLAGESAGEEEAEGAGKEDLLQGVKECGSTPFELMGELGLSPSALSYYLSKLRKQGVLRKEKQGKNVFYVVEEPQEALKLIISYRESFTDNLVNSFMEAWGL